MIVTLLSLLLPFMFLFQTSYVLENIGFIQMIVGVFQSRMVVQFFYMLLFFFFFFL